MTPSSYILDLRGEEMVGELPYLVKRDRLIYLTRLEVKG